MNNSLRTFYTIIVIVSLIIYLANLDISLTRNPSKAIKYLTLCLSGVIGVYSLYNTNKYVDKYLLPLLIFLNIGILLYISIDDNELTNIHVLSMVGIIYLLLTFKFNELELKNGILVQPNKSWIYQYILILGLWFISSTGRGWIMPNNPVLNKILSCMILVYPLLFPIEEFFIHRCGALVVAYLMLNLPLKLKKH